MCLWNAFKCKGLTCDFILICIFYGIVKVISDDLLRRELKILPGTCWSQFLLF